MAVFPVSYKARLQELRHGARQPISFTVESLREANYLNGIQLNFLLWLCQTGLRIFYLIAALEYTFVAHKSLERCGWFPWHISIAFAPPNMELLALKAKAQTPFIFCVATALEKYRAKADGLFESEWLPVFSSTILARKDNIGMICSYECMHVAFIVRTKHESSPTQN